MTPIKINPMLETEFTDKAIAKKDALKKHIEDVWHRADCLCTEQQVNRAIAQVARAIERDLADKNPLVICIMNGGLLFTSQLLLRLPFILELDYLHATRYKNTTKGGALDWIVKPRTQVKGRHILLLDDILDEGATLVAVMDYLKAQEVASIHTAIMVEKQHDRKAVEGLTADYIALKLEDNYLFGFGMDYQGYLRNAAGIYAVMEDAKEDDTKVDDTKVDDRKVVGDIKDESG